jgi:hypothetical protein
LLLAKNDDRFVWFERRRFTWEAMAGEKGLNCSKRISLIEEMDTASVDFERDHTTASPLVAAGCSAK